MGRTAADRGPAGLDRRLFQRFGRGVAPAQVWGALEELTRNRLNSSCPALSRASTSLVPLERKMWMAGSSPAIHIFLSSGTKDVDARLKAGHDEFNRLRVSSSKAPQT